MVLPENIAFNIVKFIAERPKKLLRTDDENKILKDYTQHSVPLRSDLTVYVKGKGPTVILVHGWGSGLQHMLKIAEFIFARGFKVILFDLSGHGTHLAKKANFADFIEDINQVYQAYKDTDGVHAIVGHSAGAMCLMAAKKQRQLCAKKYVCISAPAFPHPPITQIKKLTGIGHKSLERFKSHYAKYFNSDWESLLSGSIYQNTLKKDESLLVVHDHDDRLVPITDKDLTTSHWSNADSLVTHGLGHTKILTNQTVCTKIADFVAN
jgi:pimeloyl-ACP methyl ester carboxylesterase